MHNFQARVKSPDFVRRGLSQKGYALYDFSILFPLVSALFVFTIRIFPLR